MSVRYRPMRPNDIRKCVEHLATHPTIRPLYGKLIEQVRLAISRVLRDDYVTINLFEEFQNSTTKLLGAGMAVFVSDDFLREAKTTPNFWIGPELVKRITSGKSPLLSEAEVRDANSTDGLNLMVWHNTTHPRELNRGEVGKTVMTAFLDTFRGFRLREVFAQAHSLEQLHGARDAGGFYFDRVKGCYGSFPDVDAGNFADEPRNVGITRELALTHGSSWVGSVFLYGAPKCGFSRAEQRLLLSALSCDGTDEELSEHLGISLFAVKQTWRSIYDRVANCLPDLLPHNSKTGAQEQSRGKQKKQRLLAYLREHPEELRPVSRKLLQRAQGSRVQNRPVGRATS